MREEIKKQIEEEKISYGLKPQKIPVSLHNKINLKGDKMPIIVFENLPRELIWENSYGVMGSDWYEPAEIEKSSELLKKYSELPFEDTWMNCKSACIGMYFNGDCWVPMDGYIRPTFAPGFSWENEYIPNQYRTNKYYFL